MPLTCYWHLIICVMQHPSFLTTWCSASLCTAEPLTKQIYRLFLLYSFSSLHIARPTSMVPFLSGDFIFHCVSSTFHFCTFLPNTTKIMTSAVRLTSARQDLIPLRLCLLSQICLMCHLVPLKEARQWKRCITALKMNWHQPQWNTAKWAQNN